MTQGNEINTEIKVFDAMENSSIDLPDNSAFADMEMSRDGQDLVLQSDGQSDIVIENYFSADPSPILESHDGSILTPELVNAFVQSPEGFASIETAAGSEIQEVGAIEELKGDATVTHLDGTTEDLTLGMPIYEGDVIQTSQDGAVNVLFIDETSMALSEGARFAVTDYSYDPATESGTTDFSVLRGVFVFTSGLIGRDDPDDVTIDTPVGSIGIRGTIIAGHINPEGESSITVVEGAIVVKNAAGEHTLDQQFGTVHVNGFNSEMQDMGVLQPHAVSQTYGSASYVVPSLFSNINDAEKEKAANEEQQQSEDSLDAQEEIIDEDTNEDSPDENLDQPQEILMDQPINDSLNFKTLLNNQQIRNYKLHKHQLGNQSKPTVDDLQNPDVIAASNKPDFTITNQLTENEQSGGVVANLNPTQIGTNFLFANDTKFSSDGNFQIIGNKIVLTSSGHSVLSGITSGSPFAAAQAWGTAYGIKAIDTDGQVIIHGFNPVISDVAANLYGTGQSLAHDAGWVNVGDVDGDGDNDFADIDVNGNAVVSDTPGGTFMHTATGGGYNSIASVGDLNNDGYNDIIAGKPSNTGGGAINTINGAITISGVPNVSQSTGVTTGDNYGFSVSGAGDVDGDGKLDYIVGATGRGGGSGSAFIESSQYGSLEITGVNAGDQIGHFVDGIGDVSGDGLSDVLIGGNNINEAYIFYGGGTSGASVASADVTINVGGSTILNGSSAGDFNGDGFDDFAISVSNGGANVQTYVVFGNSSMVDLTMTDLENPDIALKLNDIGGYSSNYSVRSLGDVNGDGFDDIEVGSSATGFHTINGGMIGNAPYVTDGATNDGSPSISNHVQASLNGQALIGALNFADGNQNNTSMNGNNGNNGFRISNNQFNNIDGGTGYDTIRFGLATPGTLDFTNINYEQISGVERIQFAQFDNNTITLTVENIFNMLKTSDNGTLKIELGAGVTAGSLNIDAATPGTSVDIALNDLGGVAATQSTVGGYDQYDVGGYTLYIDQNVTTAVV